MKLGKSHSYPPGQLCFSLVILSGAAPHQTTDFIYSQTLRENCCEAHEHTIMPIYASHE
jgi:hypothetical protein